MVVPSRFARFAHPQDRRFVLGVIVVALVPAFAIAHLVVDRYKDQRERLAVAWSAQGDRQLTGDPAAAVVDFQTALAYGAGEETELKLAEALAAARRPAEARAHLLTLWSEQPGNGEINLELARIAAASGAMTDAVRYYHGAVDGAWEDHPATARRSARLELARLLLSTGQKTRAQSELIALIDDLPPDPQLITEVGRLILQSGSDSRALGLFQRALALDPDEADAARLAGEVAYRAGNDSQAVAFLTQATGARPLPAGDREMLDVALRAMALDPSAVRGARPRAARIATALSIARARLDRCNGAAQAVTTPDLVRLSERVDQASKVKPRTLQRDSDIAEEILSLAFDVETQTPGGACGGDTTDDRALQRLASRRPAASR